MRERLAAAMKALTLCIAVAALGAACGSAADDCGCDDGETCVEGVCVADGDPPPGAEEVSCEIATSAPDSLLNTCFSSIQAGRLAPNLRVYEPRFELFRDGTAKRRWVYLPPGSTVDVESTDDWEFPQGTIFWQQFSDTDRVETQMLEKTGAGTGTDAWRANSYLWLADQSDAHLTTNGLPPQADQDYTIESKPGYVADPKDTCVDCHQASSDFALGFGALQLSDTSLQGSVEVWSENGYLSTAQSPVSMVGEELDRDVLGYLHSNCGSCHSPQGSEGASGMDLRYTVATTTSVLDTNTMLTAAYQNLRLTPGVAAFSNIYLRLKADPMDTAGSYDVDAAFRSNLASWIGAIESQTALPADLPTTVGSSVSVDAGTSEGLNRMGYPTTTTDGPDTVFIVSGSVNFRSRVIVPIDTTKKYRVSGRFRSMGAPNAKLHFGLAPYDADTDFITHSESHYVATSNAVTVDATMTTATSIVTGQALSGWNQPGTAAYTRLIGFYYDGDTSHLPDYVHWYTNGNTYGTDSVDGSYSTATGTTVSLNVALPDEVLASLTANTAIRNQYSGSTYLYTAASGAIVPETWTVYSGELTGEAFNGGFDVFRPETRFAKFLILANNGTTASPILFDDLKIEVIP